MIAQPKPTANKKYKTPFVVSRDGVLYVHLDCIMHPLCALADGVSMTFFGRSKKAYLPVDDAIAWCKKEAK